MTVEVTDLVKKFDGKLALNIPHLVVADADVIGLIGGNGAGKTTMLRIVLDLMKSTQGIVRVNGRGHTVDAEWKQFTGSYLDDSFLIGFLTPHEFFTFVGKVYGMAAETIETAIEPYRSFLPGEDLTSVLIRDLSTGNAKKVGIVAAMFVSPRLLVLDEPFANLDPRSQIQLKVLLRRLNGRKRSTIILSSHDLLHVTDVCNRIALLENGHLVQDIATSDETLADLQRYFGGGQIDDDNEVVLSSPRR